MHTIHHTEAIIVRSEPSGEANKRLWLFTKEFGLLVVMVQGVRKPEAKLRSQLTDYGVISVDLIKGKNTWRLISARSIRTPLHAKERSFLARAYVRTISLLERFLTGEGQHHELFEHILSCGALIEKEGINARAFDALSLWKVLVLLGYCAVAEEEEPFFTLPFDRAIQLVDESRVKRLIKSATDAISYSHL